jgi:hypothetical protein
VRARALMVASVALAAVLFARRASASVPKSSSAAPEPSGGLPDWLVAIVPARSSSGSEGSNGGDEAATVPFVPALGLAVLAPGSVPERLNMRANPGQNPKSPPSGIYIRYPLQIDAVVRDVNWASTGLDVGLNSWWRTLDQVGEPLSQHDLGTAIDFQGPDQEVMAARLKQRGWRIIRESNAGVPYHHLHGQKEAAGYLARLGITRELLRQWTA